MLLTAALVGPFLVDWTVYRDLIETQAGKLLGEEVRVLGEADVRLLPTPRVSLETVRVGPPEAPIFTADRVELEVDLSPLLKREIDVVGLTFIGPEVHVAVQPDGSVVGPVLHLAQGPLEWVDPAKVRFDQIDVKRGRLLIDDRRTGETARVDGVNMSGSGRSFHGPFEGMGSLSFDGTTYDVRFATGSHVIGAPLTVKARIRPTDRPVDFTVDGEATLSSAPARFTGAMTVSPRPQDDSDEPAVPWSINGTLDLAPDALTVPEAEVRYGPIERPLVMQASLQVPFQGDQGFRLNLASRQMDLDGLLKALGHDRTDSARPAERLAPLLSALDFLPILESDGTVSARLVSIVAGDAVIENATVEAKPTAEGWRIVSARAGLPGGTTVTSSGQLMLKEGPRYDGEVAVASEKPGALARWWRGGQGGAIPVRSLVALDGALKVGGGEIAMPAMRLRNGGATVLGSLRYRPETDRVRAALDLDLRSQALDLAPVLTTARALSEGGALSSGVRGLGTDVTLYLTADAATLDGVSASGVVLDAGLIDGALTLDRLAIADLGGTKLDASGNLGKAGDSPSGQVTGHLEGDRLSGLARLAEDLAPGNAVARRFAQATPDLAPVALDFTLSGRRAKQETSLDLSLNGTAGGSEITLNAEVDGDFSDWRAVELDTSLRATNPDGDRLMRQLGIAALPVGSDVPGEIALGVTGTVASGLSVDATADLVGASLRAGGTVTADANAPATVDLDLSLRSDDLSLPALASGRALPLLAGGMPLTLDAHLAGPIDGVAISDFEGRVAGIRLSGSGTADLSGDIAAVDGDLAIGEVDLQVLAELLLGSETWSYAGDTVEGWPDAPFGPSSLAGVAADLNVTTDRMWIGAREIRDARFGLSLAPDRLALSEVTGRYAGGGLEGALDLVRSDGQATLSGRLALSDADLGGLIWSAGERPVASGSLDLALDFQSMGRSVQAMVAALSGSGSFTARDGLIRQLDPQGILDAIRQADDAGVEVDPEAVRTAVAEGLASGTLAYDQVSGTIGIASGIARIGEVTVETDAADVSGNASIDLPAWTLSGAVDLSLAPPDPDLVPDVTADVRLTFAGPLDSPSAQLQIDPLAGYLTLRETERERRRLEALEKELQERRRREEEMLRRLEEERRAEAERQRQEEERRQAEEAARAAEDAARAAEEQNSAPTEGEVAPAEPEPRPTLAAPPIADEGAAASPPPAPSTLPSAGVLSPDPADPIGSLIQQGPRLFWPTPLGPPSEIDPPAGSGRAPLDLRAPAEQRSEAASGPEQNATSTPFTIERRDLQPLAQ